VAVNGQYNKQSCTVEALLLYASILALQLYIRCSSQTESSSYPQPHY